MIRLTQDKRPHNGCADIYVNPSEVTSIEDIYGQRSGENRSCVTLRNGVAYEVTDYASVVAEKVNAALEKLEAHPVDTGNTLKKETN